MGKQSFRRRRAILAAASLALTVVLLLLFPSSAPGQSTTPPPFVTRPDEELLLLEVVLGRTVLSQAVPAWASGNGAILLPLGELSRLLDFAIEVDVGNGTADGFFIAEGRQFHLDAGALRALVAGTAMTLTPQEVEVHQDDIYIDARTLSRLWPIDFEVNLYASQVAVAPREAIPLQTRQEREERIRKGLGRPSATREQLPRTDTPYSLWDGPFIDQTLQLFGGNTRGRANHASFSTYASGDLLWHQATLFLTGTDDDLLEESRFRIGRMDPNPNLLGPLRAREYAAGEILSPGIDLLLSPSSGEGFLVSNFPLQYQARFDRQTFQGDLPPGWDVELYQNDALIAYQQSTPDGRYLFEDVPLLFGLNIFRLVFHGPQGQKRQEISRFNVGESLVPEGELYYRLLTDNPDSTGRRSSLELSYGLNRRLSLDLAAADAEIDLGRQRYGKIGASAYWDLVFGKASFAFNDEGGSAAQIAAQTRIGKVNLSMTHAELEDFVSEIFRPTYGPLKSASVLRTDTILTLGGGLVFPVSLELRRFGNDSGGEAWELEQRTGGQYRRTFLSNHFTGILLDGLESAPPSVVQGAFLASRFLREFALRGEINYQVLPELDIRAATILAETFSIPGWNLQGSVSHTLLLAETTVAMTANRREGPFALGGTVSYSDRTGAAVSLNLFAGTARDAFSRAWHTSARSTAGSGAFSALVFIDRNGNGAFDPDEQTVPDVGFFVNRASITATTDQNGYAFYAGLPTGFDSEISISAATLEDPLWKPVVSAIAVLGRPGKAIRLEFPLMVTGELTGTVFLERGEREPREAAGVRLELVSPEGEVAMRTVTAYDGFFELIGVPPGSWLLQADPEQMERLGLSQSPRSIVIEPDGTILDGIEFIIRG